MDSDILEFCELGNGIEIERCLNEGVSANFQNNEGETPLQVVAANGFCDLVDLLLKYGAAIDLTNNYGWTPLMHAARYGHSSTVSLLIKMKAKVNICNKLGITAMVAAACSGDLSTLKLLVEAGALVDHMSAGNETSECDFSTVMAASFLGHDIILQYLLENGAEINHCSAITGLSPLMLSAYSGHKHIAHILIDKGADVHKKDVCDRTALDLARAFSHLEVESYLEDLTASEPGNGSSQIDIFQAIKNGDFLNVKSLLENNQDAAKTAASPDGLTPLMMATKFNHCNIANLIISYGASLDVQDMENGWTALMHAVFNNNVDVVYLLLETGADIHLHALNGYTALDLARNKEADQSIIESLTSRLTPQGLKSCNLSTDCTSRGRLSAPERLHSKRSLSQTRVKEWIGGVAQHLQNKMLTRRTNRCSENVPSIEITLPDDSTNEVFVEQLPVKESDKEKSNQPVMLPPDLYLAWALKEHKVEAIKPPFLPISTGYIDSMRGISQNKSISDKSSKPGRNFLHTPNLLKNYTRKSSVVASNRNTFKRKTVPEERVATNDINKCMIEIHPERQKNSSSVKNPNLIELGETVVTSKPCQGNLTVLLNKESLQKYADTFRDQEVDIETFQHLTKDDLNEIGIQNSESQKKLLEVIKKLQISEESMSNSISADT